MSGLCQRVSLYIVKQQQAQIAEAASPLASHYQYHMTTEPTRAALELCQQHIKMCDFCSS
jgi:hypothetical protein